MTEAPLPQGASDRPAGASEMVERVAHELYSVRKHWWSDQGQGRRVSVWTSAWRFFSLAQAPLTK